MLIFQGLEWNIPAAEHGTVFVHPGQGEVEVLKAFENGYDGSVRGASANTAHSGRPNTTAGDFWPGYYGRTLVGASRARHLELMAGVRAGNVWVDHGGLVDEVEVEVRTRGASAGLGGVITTHRGNQCELVVRIVPARSANWAQFEPKLKKVDVIQGRVTGPAEDRDTFRAPETTVVKSYDVSGQSVVELRYDLGVVGDTGFYVRLRGSDGNRSQVGYFGAATDPEGPAIDIVGDADPWLDLWFYTNPIFVLPRT
ncbi:MAG: hypothetical protein V9G19_19530 [Tetrasphaera sp.]